MRRLFAFLLVCLISIPALAQSKHPFTFEDMMKLKRVGEPVPSPDGKWVLFSVVDVNLEANTKTPHIWIVPLQPFHVGKEEKVIGGIPRNELSLQKTDSERILIADQDGTRPRWAPDGKRFAFISNKESGSQVWIADFDSAAGKVTRTFRLTKIATEADGELWSPDGNTFFLSREFIRNVMVSHSKSATATPRSSSQPRNRKSKQSSQSACSTVTGTHTPMVAAVTSS